MCRFRSIIVLKTGEVLSLEESDSHSEIINEFSLKEGPLESRNFVKIEINPVSGSLFSKDWNNWKLWVDEVGTLPGWWLEDEANLKDRCFQNLEGFVDKVLKTGVVSGSLNLQGTAVKDLGKLEKVSGSLYLQGTAVKDLGKLEKVSGSLYLQGTAVKDLGNLKECGSLDLRGTKIIVPQGLI